jgi:hypothetical protein
MEKTLVAARARWRITVLKETNEPLTDERVKEITKSNTTEEWSKIKGGAEWVGGIIIGENADEAKIFINVDGTVEEYSIWEYNIWHSEGCIWFNFSEPAQE